MGAFICAGKLLSHVHIAGLKERIIPGVHPEADQYVDGFKGLKLIGYRGAVSFEGGWPRNRGGPQEGAPAGTEDEADSQHGEAPARAVGDGLKA